MQSIAGNAVCQIGVVVRYLARSSALADLLELLETNG